MSKGAGIVNDVDTAFNDVQGIFGGNSAPQTTAAANKRAPFSFDDLASGLSKGSGIASDAESILNGFNDIFGAPPQTTAAANKRDAPKFLVRVPNVGPDN
jgi:hypothetical protein